MGMGETIEFVPDFDVIGLVLGSRLGGRVRSVGLRCRWVAVLRVPYSPFPFGNLISWRAAHQRRKIGTIKRSTRKNKSAKLEDYLA